VAVREQREHRCAVLDGRPDRRRLVDLPSLTSRPNATTRDRYPTDTQSRSLAIHSSSSARQEHIHAWIHDSQWSSACLWLVDAAHSRQRCTATPFGADIDGDDYTDVLGLKPDGTLWLYRNSHNAGAPFSTGTLIGTGWNIY
jgi:hypothetical protein